jgi:hypothetical protein
MEKLPTPAGRHRRGGRGLPLLLLLLVAALARPAWAVNPPADEEQKKKDKKELEIKKEAEKPKLWRVDLQLYTYFTVVHDNEYSNDAYHIMYLRGNYDVPAFWKLPAIGRFSLRLDVTRRYVADPDESGFLFGDMLFYWSRAWKFNVAGQDFDIRPYVMWTFPTSKLARKEGNIARPTLLFALHKALPYNLHAFLRPYFRLNWHRYAEMERGAPNTKWQMGYDIQLTYNFHLHKRLGFGATWGQEWYNRYTSRDGYSQPFNSQYYWEVFTGYTLLQKPINLSTYLALISGRVNIEDGVYRFHWMDRDETLVYILVNASY